MKNSESSRADDLADAVSGSSRALAVSSVFEPFTSAIVFVGIHPISVPFGNGIRCLGGGIQRFPISQGDANGTLDVGPGINAQAPMPVGATGHYQVFYRDVTGPCGTGLNTTNGLAQPWTP